MIRNSTTLLLSFIIYLSAWSQTTTRIITDFGGYWSSTTASPNAVQPDTSHMLLGFTHDGVTYSTGVNDGVLITNSVTYTPGNWWAFPVAGIAGSYGPGAGGGLAVYTALAKKVDGSPNAANTPAVSDKTIRDVLIDGIHGLDLGTGVTNLPTSAVMNFQIYAIDPTKIDDDEPDILLTQIADPTNSLSDVFSLRDAGGNLVGNTFSQNTQSLQPFGIYQLDLYNLTPNTPFNVATVYNANAINTTRPIRVTAVRLSQFGITAANAGQIRSLRVSPSAISDYAFIAYNANSINLTPNISQNPPLTNLSICDNGTAHFSVVATAASGGALTHSWEESTDNGATWHAVTDGGNYSGTTTDRLAVVDPANGNLYRGTAVEQGNPNPVTSETFQVTVIPSPAAPTSVTISGGGTICLGAPVQLTSAVTGGTNLYYQWQADPTGGGTFTTIPDANLATYVPPPTETGIVNYRLQVSSGSACIPERFSNTQVVTVNGISSTTPDEICGPGQVTLNATSNAGTVSWYTEDVGGSLITTANTYSPTISGSTTYYVEASGCPAPAIRVPVTATIYEPTAGGSAEGSTSVSPGSNNTTLTLAGYEGNVVRWQSSTDGFVAEIVDLPVTSNQLTVTDLTETTQFRAEVQNGTCAPAFSAPATINISVLPIRLGSVRAIRENSGIRVQWTAYNQQNTVRFEIERSTNGNDFTKVHTIASTGASNDETYEWLDINPAPGRYYYRIKEVYLSGTDEYSTVVSAVFENDKPAISVYPNPVKDRNLSLQFMNMTAGKYQVNYINNSGQVVNQQTVIHSGGYRTYTLPVPASVSRGVYRLVITGADEASRTSSSIIIL